MPRSPRGRCGAPPRGWTAGYGSGGRTGHGTADRAGGGDRAGEWAATEKRVIRHARFAGRWRLPEAREECLYRSEVAALQEVVAGDSDALRRAPGFTRLARAYLHLLEWNERHREMVAAVLAVGE